MNLTRGIHIAVFNLVVVGILGCFLRYLLLHPVSGVNYSYIIHAHSHLAFLGWVFMAIFVLILYAYLPEDNLKKGKYLTIFILLQSANMGMLFTFPIMGYALWSIVFSASHAILAMVFAWFIIKDVNLNRIEKHSISFSWIKWALILMVVSNLAPFALGPVSATQGKTDLYYLLIYFYLHFQYNGWFTFALFGLILWMLEYQGVNTKVRLVQTGFKLKLIAIVPAFILSSLWTEPDLIWYIIGGLSAATQLVGLVCVIYFLIINKGVLGLDKEFTLRVLYWVGIMAIIFQHILMLLSAFPEMASIAYSRNIVIAYLHLVLLGFVSVWIFLFLLKLKMVILTSVFSIGIGIFLPAFIVTECLLIFQGQVSNVSEWLFYLALVQLAGIVCIAISVKKIRLSA